MSAPPPPPPSSDGLKMKRGFNMKELKQGERLLKFMSEMCKGVRGRRFHPRRDIILEAEKPIKKSEVDYLKKVYYVMQNGPLVRILQFCNIIEILLSLIYVNKHFHKTVVFMIDNGLVTKINHFYSSHLFSSRVALPEHTLMKLLKNSSFDVDSIHSEYVCGWRLIDFAICKSYNNVLKYLLKELGVNHLNGEKSFEQYFINYRNIEGLKILVEERKEVKISRKMLIFLGNCHEYEYIKSLKRMNRSLANEHISSLYANVISEYLKKIIPISEDKDEHEKKRRIFEFCRWYNDNVEKYDFNIYRLGVICSNSGMGIKNLEAMKFLLNLDHSNRPTETLPYRISYDLLHEWLTNLPFIDIKYPEEEIKTYIEWLVEGKEHNIDTKCLINYFLVKGDSDTAIHKLGLDQEFMRAYSVARSYTHRFHDISVFQMIRNNLNDQKKFLKSMEDVARVVGVSVDSINKFFHPRGGEEEDKRIEKMKILWYFYYSRDWNRPKEYSKRERIMAIIRNCVSAKYLKYFMFVYGGEDGDDDDDDIMNIFLEENNTKYEEKKKLILDEEIVIECLRSRYIRNVNVMKTLVGLLCMNGKLDLKKVYDVAIETGWKLHVGEFVIEKFWKTGSVDEEY